jgi:hypothetical protein
VRRIWCYHMVVYSIVNMIIPQHPRLRFCPSSRSVRDPCSDTGIHGARGGNRTHRYQVESLGSWPLDDSSQVNGLNGRLRTAGLMVPNHALCQAELHSGEALKQWWERQESNLHGREASRLQRGGPASAQLSQMVRTEGVEPSASRVSGGCSTNRAACADAASLVAAMPVNCYVYVVVKGPKMERAPGEVPRGSQVRAVLMAASSDPGSPLRHRRKFRVLIIGVTNRDAGHDRDHMGRVSIVNRSINDSLRPCRPTRPACPWP